MTNQKKTAVKCSRCGALIPNAVFSSGQHVCNGMRRISELPRDLMMKVATRRMTESEAFAELDAR